MAGEPGMAANARIRDNFEETSRVRQEIGQLHVKKSDVERERVLGATI
jgi:hypothetical protein